MVDIREWTDLLPTEIAVTDPDVVASYARDQSRFTDHSAPRAVLMPRTTGEVSRCMEVMHALGVPVVPRGAGSGLSGAANASADSVVLSLHRMNKILEINPADRLAVVQPGVVTATLRAAASAAGLFYPPTRAASTRARWVATSRRMPAACVA